MRKITKYFLIIVATFLATFLVISLFYIRLAYRSFLANEHDFPPAIARFFEKITNQPSTPAIVLKPEYTIKILEGWASRDISQYFEQSGRMHADDFLKVAGFPQMDYRRNKSLTAPQDFSTQYSFLADKPKYYGLEGYLFPDTYRVYASSTVTDIIEKMLDNFNEKLTPKMRADIKVSGKTIYEIITLASIIEKEAPINYQTNNNRDARIIAGVFYNRLEIGQGLQSDATLSYVYGDNKPAHSGEELNNSSPYNTYKYRGLPPGPICNPGILAIEAAIYPIKTDYNYFLTTNNGEVIYARTYEEHLQNKYKYLK
ncbi:MAG: endolytic transglycosylase MltG [Candidatus Falkowbacteria bacterium]